MFAPGLDAPPVTIRNGKVALSTVSLTTRLKIDYSANRVTGLDRTQRLMPAGDSSPARLRLMSPLSAPAVLFSAQAKMVSVAAISALDPGPLAVAVDADGSKASRELRKAQSA